MLRNFFRIIWRRAKRFFFFFFFSARSKAGVPLVVGPNWARRTATVARIINFNKCNFLKASSTKGPIHTYTQPRIQASNCAGVRVHSSWKLLSSSLSARRNYGADRRAPRCGFRAAESKTDIAYRRTRMQRMRCAAERSLHVTFGVVVDVR